MKASVALARPFSPSSEVSTEVPFSMNFLPPVPFSVFDRLSPADPGYARLLERLAEYRAIKARGGWRTIPGGRTLEPGASDPRIPALRRRLAITDGATPDAAPGEDAELYDPELVAATVRFQIRHGLSADGRVGPRTLAAHLNSDLSEDHLSSHTPGDCRPRGRSIHSHALRKSLTMSREPWRAAVRTLSSLLSTPNTSTCGALRQP